MLSLPRSATSRRHCARSMQRRGCPHRYVQHACSSMHVAAYMQHHTCSSIHAASYMQQHTCSIIYAASYMQHHTYTTHAVMQHTTSMYMPVKAHTNTHFNAHAIFVQQLLWQAWALRHAFNDALSMLRRLGTTTRHASARFACVLCVRLRVAACMLHVCCKCVACMLHVCCMYVTGILIYVANMLRLCCMYVACMPRAHWFACCITSLHYIGHRAMCIVLIETCL